MEIPFYWFISKEKDAEEFVGLKKIKVKAF